MLNFRFPEESMRTFCNGDMSIGKQGMDVNKLPGVIEETLNLSLKTDHPRFYNGLYHGVDYYAKMGNYVSEMLNTNSYTYEVAPVFSIVEKVVVEYAAKKMGFYENSAGLTVPGGSVANMYGMVLARHRKFPEIKKTGLKSVPQLVIYTSEESHYSIAKGANWLGIGLENVVQIPVDDQSRMIPEELDMAIAKTIDKGHVPLMVNVTLGSTVSGSFDDIEKVYGVLKKYREAKIWLHGDGAWGGAYAFSPILKSQYMSGSHLLDSMAWNPHKMLGAPLQGSLFLVNNNENKPDFRLLQEANSASASYLFMQDKFYDVAFDAGDQTMQCGRKPDAFKIWFMLKARGDDFFQELVENAHKMSRLLAKKVKEHENFELVIEPACTNVGFVYIPPSLKREMNKPFFEMDEEWVSKVSALQAKIKSLMMQEGTLMIAYQPLKSRNLQNFFRMVFHCTPKPTEKDVNFIINEIHRLGQCL